MKLIRPLTSGADGYGIGSAMLNSSSIAEPDTGETAWVSGTTYAIGDERIVAGSVHRKFRRLTAGAGTLSPELDLNAWQDIGPTNRWAMFDKVVGTSSTDTGTLEVVVEPGIVNAISLLGLVGSSVQVTMVDVPTGITVYDETVDLTSDEIVIDWYMYFFEPITPRTTATLLDLPPYSGGRITVEITGSGTVACGICYFGNAIELGDVQYGASVGIIDYSKKTVDAETGRVSVTEGSFRDRAQLQLYLPSGRVDVLKRTLTAYRATPVVWVGVDSMYEALTLFGFCKDFSVVIAYPTLSTCSLDIEGLI